MPTSESSPARSPERRLSHRRWPHGHAMHGPTNAQRVTPLRESTWPGPHPPAASTQLPVAASPAGAYTARSHHGTRRCRLLGWCLWPGPSSAVAVQETTRTDTWLTSGSWTAYQSSRVPLLRLGGGERDNTIGVVMDTVTWTMHKGVPTHAAAAAAEA